MSLSIARRNLTPRLPISHILLTCMLASLSAPSAAETGKLVVDLQNVRDDSGHIRASLYREAETFRKEEKALQVISLPAKAGALSLSFNDLPPGRYALMVYHDSNADQKLNLRLGMFPIEGYGLSNNPKVMGPPKFEDSAFDFRLPETQISVKLAY